LAFNGFQL